MKNNNESPIMEPKFSMTNEEIKAIDGDKTLSDKEKGIKIKEFEKKIESANNLMGAKLNEKKFTETPEQKENNLREAMKISMNLLADISDAFNSIENIYNGHQEKQKDQIVLTQDSFNTLIENINSQIARLDILNPELLDSKGNTELKEMETKLKIMKEYWEAELENSEKSSTEKIRKAA